MVGAGIRGEGVRTAQLRLVRAFVALSISAAAATVLALLEVSVWQFALLGVVPGLLLGALFGPRAARTSTPVAAAVLAGFVGWFVALAIDVGGIALLSLTQAAGFVDGEPTPLGYTAMLLGWGAPVLILGGIPASLVISFMSRLGRAPVYSRMGLSVTRQSHCETARSVYEPPATAWIGAESPA